MGVNDANGTLQAGIQIDNNGDGHVFADRVSADNLVANFSVNAVIKNFRIDHPKRSR